jgi:hypothetical protein
MKSHPREPRTRAWLPLACAAVASMCFAHFAQAADAAKRTAAGTVSKEDILAAVVASRSRIQDLSVRFRYDVVKGERDEAMYRHHEFAVVKGVMLYVDRVVSPNPAVRKGVGGLECSYNGLKTTIHLRGAGRATVATERVVDPNRRGFFEVMLWDPQPVAPEEDLVSLLKLPEARLRDTVEWIGSDACHVVDVRSPLTGRLHTTVWLATSKEFLPLKIHYFSVSNGRLLIEFIVHEVFEAADGLWFPVLATRKLYPVLSSITEEGERRMQVDGWREGRPDLRVNTGVPDDFFDLWKRLPPGTLLVDRDAQTAITVEGTDYVAAARNLDLSIESAELLVPERAQGPVGEQRAPPQTVGRQMAQSRGPGALVLKLAVAVLAGGAMVWVLAAYLRKWRRVS